MFDTIAYEADQLVEEKLSGMKHLSDNDRAPTGMDRRALYTAWYNDDVLIVHRNNNANLRYYGGFEYVDDDDIVTVGNYVIYSGNADRVQKVLDRLNEVADTAETEDDED